MKHVWTRALPLVLALPGCALFGSGLDLATVTQNQANVNQIVAENEVYLAADAKAESLKAVQRDRNKAAVELARRIVEAAGR